MHLKHHTSAWAGGFSLVEVLVAASIGVVVVLAAMGLLVEFGNQDRELQVGTLRKEELRRALSFMQMEVRMANTISSSATTMPVPETSNEPDSVDLNLCTGSSRIPILGLTLRQFQKDLTGQQKLYSYGVIYTLESLSTSGSNIWKGPYIIYRCGPELTQDGSYSRSDVDKAIYSKSPVVDGVAATNSRSCPSGTVKLPSDTNALIGGFVACVQTDGRSVQLFLTGHANGEDLPPIVGSAAARSL